MCIHFEHESWVGVAETVLHGPRVKSPSDPLCDRRVPQAVESQIRQSCPVDGRAEDASCEVASTDGVAIPVAEQQVIRTAQAANR